MNLKNWMDVVGHRITEGDSYGWSCFGPNAYNLSFWNQDHDGHSSNVVFDTKTQEVYVVEVCDYAKQKAFRYINPTYVQSYKKEVVHHESDDKAWDDISWIDLEVFEDWEEKATAILNNMEYDERVKVPLELPQDELFELMMKAHERDITLNQLITEALQAAIDEYERDPEGMKQKAKKWKEDNDASR